MTSKLYVRYAQPADEKAVFDYYEQNQHQFVVKRDAEVWRERLAAGAVTLIEDAQGKIVAAAVTYPVIVKDEKGEDVHRWSELGSVRISLDGIGLFKALVSAQVVRAFLLEPPEDRFAAEIIVGNAHSKHVFLKEGATPFDIPKKLEEKVSYSIDPSDPGLPVEWFQIAKENMPHMAQNLLDIEKNPVVKNKKTGEEFEIDFSRCVVMTHLHKAVENLAKADLGPAQKPDLSAGIKTVHHRFAP